MSKSVQRKRALVISEGCTYNDEQYIRHIVGDITFYERVADGTLWHDADDKTFADRSHLHAFLLQAIIARHRDLREEESAELAMSLMRLIDGFGFQSAEAEQEEDLGRVLISYSHLTQHTFDQIESDDPPRWSDMCARKGKRLGSAIIVFSEFGDIASLVEAGVPADLYTLVQWMQEDEISEVCLDASYPIIDGLPVYR